MSGKIIVQMKWIKVFHNWVIAVKSWNANRMMNHKSAKKHEIILKTYKNFSKIKEL